MSADTTIVDRILRRLEKRVNPRGQNRLATVCSPGPKGDNSVQRLSKVTTSHEAQPWHALHCTSALFWSP